MIAMNANFSLQLIVESFSRGAEQVASTTICIDSFKLIHTLVFEEASAVDKTPIALASEAAQFA
jgi:hypothetical protein